MPLYNTLPDCKTVIIEKIPPAKIIKATALTGSKPNLRTLPHFSSVNLADANLNLFQKILNLFFRGRNLL